MREEGTYEREGFFIWVILKFSIKQYDKLDFWTGQQAIMGQRVFFFLANTTN